MKHYKAFVSLALVLCVLIFGIYTLNHIFLILGISNERLMLKSCIMTMLIVWMYTVLLISKMGRGTSRIVFHPFVGDDYIFHLDKREVLTKILKRVAIVAALIFFMYICYLNPDFLHGVRYLLMVVLMMIIVMPIIEIIKLSFSFNTEYELWTLSEKT